MDEKDPWEVMLHLQWLCRANDKVVVHSECAS